MTLGEFRVTVGRSDLSANGQLTNYIGYLLRGDMLSGRLYEIRTARPERDHGSHAPSSGAG